MTAGPPDVEPRRKPDRTRFRAADASLVRTVLVRSRLHGGSLYVARRRGGLADLRSHRQRLRSRPGRARAIPAVRRAAGADRPDRRSLRPPHRAARVSDRPRLRRADLRLRHVRRLAHARRDPDDLVRHRHVPRLRGSHHAHAGAGPGAKKSAAACDRIGDRGQPERRHLRPGAWRPDLLDVRADHGLFDMRHASLRRAC